MSPVKNVTHASDRTKRAGHRNKYNVRLTTANGHLSFAEIKRSLFIRRNQPLKSAAKLRMSGFTGSKSRIVAEKRGSNFESAS